VAAGFRNVITPLRLGGTDQGQAGFVSPLPVLRIGGSTGGVQAGFLGVLPGVPLGGISQAGFLSIVPPLPLGGATTGLTAGYIGVLPILGLGAGEPAIIVPEDVHPPGMGRVWHEEDEEIMAIIMSFLEIRR
jgi:hypothetical protein